MERIKALVVGLTVILLVESSIIALPLIQPRATHKSVHAAGSPEIYSFGFGAFNRPVTNNTDQEFGKRYNGSWTISIWSSLRALAENSDTEAEMAFAPSYPVEGKSIPTIIVQERADGLLRIEYFAQSWPNTYGLILYNSTSPGWRSGNVTLDFLSLGRPSVIDPQIAPRSNGNLTISIGSNAVFADYPIAWASLDEVYVYGLPGSSFTSGGIGIAVQALSNN